MRKTSFFCKHVFWLVAFAACTQQKSEVDKAALNRYLNDPQNAVIKVQEVNGITLRLRYQPTELMVMQELNPAEHLTKQRFDSLEKKYASNYYFLLTLSRGGKEAIRQLGNFERYSDMVSVLSFELSRFVNLTTPEKDTVELNDFLFDQTYGTSNGNTVLLCFSKEKLAKARALNVNLSECGLGTGTVKFTFEKQDLDQIPSLDYSGL